LCNWEDAEKQKTQTFESKMLQTWHCSSHSHYSWSWAQQQLAIGGTLPIREQSTCSRWLSGSGLRNGEDTESKHLTQRIESICKWCGLDTAVAIHIATGLAHNTSLVKLKLNFNIVWGSYYRLGHKHSIAVFGSRQKWCQAVLKLT